MAINRSPGSHLAGGAAIHIGPGSLRTSDDLDYFHDEEQLVAQAFAADRSALEGAGFTVTPTLSQPGFIRALIASPKGETKVEWAHDSSWRFMPPIRDPVVGYRLHPVDLSINKILALAGRDEPRDFLDALFVHEHYLSLGALCWAAVGKDPGYNPSLLVEMLARKGKYQAADFRPLKLAAQPDLLQLKRSWINAIAEARVLVQRLPANDAGCLYLDPKTKKFVTPGVNLDRLLRHPGSKGGVIPLIGVAPALIADAKSRRLLRERYGGQAPADSRP
jgi:hypothetical protein